MAESSLCLGLIACGVAGPSVPPSATVIVRLTTGGYELDVDGYTLLTDDANPRPVADSGEVSLLGVTPGSHIVELQGLASNCAIVGLNPAVLTATAGDTTAITFAIACRSTAAVPEVHMDLRADEVSPRDTNRVVVSVLPDSRDSVLEATLTVTGYGAQTVTLPFRGTGLQEFFLDFPIPVQCITDVSRIDYRIRSRVVDTLLQTEFTIRDTTPPAFGPFLGDIPLQAGDSFFVSYGAHDFGGLASFAVHTRGLITADSAVSLSRFPVGAGGPLTLKAPAAATPGDSVLYTISAVDLCGNTSSAMIARVLVVP